MSNVSVNLIVTMIYQAIKEYFTSERKSGCKVSEGLDGSLVDNSGNLKSCFTNASYMLGTTRELSYVIPIQTLK